MKYELNKTDLEKGRGYLTCDEHSYLHVLTSNYPSLDLIMELTSSNRQKLVKPCIYDVVFDIVVSLATSKKS